MLLLTIKLQRSRVDFENASTKKYVMSCPDSSARILSSLAQLRLAPCPKCCVSRTGRGISAILWIATLPMHCVDCTREGSLAFGLRPFGHSTLRTIVISYVCIYNLYRQSVPSMPAHNI